MNNINKFNNRIGKVEEFVLSFSIILLTLLLLANVVARKVFLNSLTFAEELAQFFLIAITFLGIGYAAKKGQHINMTAAIDVASFRLKKIMFITISLVSAILMILFAVYGFRYMLFIFEKGRITPALEIPRWIYTLSIPVGFFLGAIQYIINLYLNLTHKDKLFMGNSTYFKEIGGETVQIDIETNQPINEIGEVIEIPGINELEEDEL